MKFPTIRIFKCPQYNCVKGTRHRAGYADSTEYYPCSFCNETGRIGVQKFGIGVPGGENLRDSVRSLLYAVTRAGQHVLHTRDLVATQASDQRDARRIRRSALDAVVVARNFHEHFFADLRELAPRHPIAQKHPYRRPKQVTQGIE